MRHMAQQASTTASTSSSPEVSMVVRPKVSLSVSAPLEDTPLDLTLRKSQQFAEKR
ncbi:unnamed protein product [Gongylonema pulchrum]|uniref:Uncharacterized protein n=1 Tax=Gongylonema pulchrum TaxID=637853 RepID=A0A183F1D4_9BILA|nr:unnamed protein product [Gongylonema pulchrum]